MSAIRDLFYAINNGYPICAYWKVYAARPLLPVLDRRMQRIDVCATWNGRDEGFPRKYSEADSKINSTRESRNMRHGVELDLGARLICRSLPGILPSGVNNRLVRLRDFQESETNRNVRGNRMRDLAQFRICVRKTALTWKQTHFLTSNFQ